MGGEIQIINDGNGLAIVGESKAVEQFLASENLPTKDLGIGRISTMLSAGSGLAQVSSEVAAQSGRWMKLTAESAEWAKKFPAVMDPKTGASYATLHAKDGSKFVKNLQFVTNPGAMLTNPAMLAGAAGLMAQLSMQQTMAEITDYLATIDEKVNDVLRNQKDAVLADMIGVDFVIEEAITIRDQVGRVSEVTWSKVQATATTIAKTQAYALRQLDGIAEKLEAKQDFGNLADAAKEAEARVQEWLAVLARCFQLQDGLGVLELDRVLDASPEELDQHRRGLQAARKNRLTLIAGATERLLARMDAAAGTANAKVLLHPAKAPDVVHASNQVSTAVLNFEGRLGIERSRQAAQARRWREAAADVRDKAMDAAADAKDKAVDLSGDGLSTAQRLGGDGLSTAQRIGGDTLGRAKSASGKLSGKLRRRQTLDEVVAEDPGSSAS